MDPETIPVAEANPDATTEPDNGTPAVDYQKRYDDLRPQYDRTQNELTQLKQWQEAVLTDEQAQRQLISEWGYAVEESQPDEDAAFSDPQVSALEQRLATIEAQAQTAESDRQLWAAEQHFNTSFQAIASERGSPLTEQEQKAIVGLALTMDADESGMPPVANAYKELQGLYEQQMEQWAKTKRTSHRVSPNGAAGTAQPDMGDKAQRQAWMAQRLADLNTD